jgi:hypothetical protein
LHPWSPASGEPQRFAIEKGMRCSLIHPAPAPHRRTLPPQSAVAFGVVASLPSGSRW